MPPLRLSKKSIFDVLIYQFALHQSLPCVKGGGPPLGGSEGLCGKSYEFALAFGEIATFYCGNPSVMLGKHDSSLYTRVSVAQSAVVNDSPVDCQSRRPGCPQAALGAPAPEVFSAMVPVSFFFTFFGFSCIVTLSR